jgi:hypothetical protein
MSGCVRCVCVRGDVDICSILQWYVIMQWATVCKNNTNNKVKELGLIQEQGERTCLWVWLVTMLMCCWCCLQVRGSRGQANLRQGRIARTDLWIVTLIYQLRVGDLDLLRLQPNLQLHFRSEWSSRSNPIHVHSAFLSTHHSKIDLVIRF